MLDYAEKGLDICEGRTRDELDSNEILYLAILRVLEVIGEAATRIPIEERDRQPEIPWRDIIDLRNRLIHGYDTVNRDIVWLIVTEDLPHLAERLRGLV